MKKNRAQKDILYISISSFILVVIWIGFNIYHQSIDSTIAPNIQSQLLPINPSFDTATIEKLKKRQKVTPSYQNTSATKEASLTPTPALNQPEIRVSTGSGSIDVLQP